MRRLQKLVKGASATGCSAPSALRRWLLGGIAGFVIQGYLMDGPILHAEDAEPTPRPLDLSTPMRAEMKGVYASFRALQPLIAGREQFVDASREGEIRRLLRDLQGHFHSVSGLSKRYTSEPGFIDTLKSIEEMLKDSEIRFNEGKKSYALWRLRGATEYCITCHTRFKISMGFMSPADDLNGLTPVQQVNFLLATRQFDKARKTLLNLVMNQDEGMDTIDLLRKLLVVHTRVSPNPDEALKEFGAILDLGKLTPYEREEVSGWMVSLKSWKKEPRRKVTLKLAEALVRAGVSSTDPLNPRRGTVELLRATAMLHSLLDGLDKAEPAVRRRALFLLGLSYSQLPPLFVDSLAEQFLEECIRDYPATDEARQSFKIYDSLIRAGFTGSRGERIPGDVIHELRELHTLAFGASSAGKI